MMGHVYQTLYYLANLIFYKIFFNAVELLSVQRQQCPIHKGALDTSIWLNMLKILSSINKGALDTSIWLNMLKILSSIHKGALDTSIWLNMLKILSFFQV